MMHRVVVSFPDSLLEEVDRLADLRQCSRSELIRLALAWQVRVLHRTVQREEMERGYAEMAGLNARLAQADCEMGEEMLARYEAVLAESEP